MGVKMNIILFLLFICIGAYIGGLLAFFNNKLPDRDAIFSNRFKCRHCNTKFRFIESIPILSYLKQKGKCLTCGKALNFECFLMEILNSILWSLIFYTFGFSWNFIYFIFISDIILIISFIDLKYLEIPIYCQILFGFFAVLYIIINPIDPLYSILFAFIYYIIIKVIKFVTEKITKTNVIGDGDLILIAICGSVLCFNSILLFFTLISIIGILFGIIWKYLKRKNVFPFAISILWVYFYILIRLTII